MNHGVSGEPADYNYAVEMRVTMIVQGQEQVQMRQKTSQKLTMQDRNRVELNGVTELLSYDSREILLESVEGMMRFAGDDLHVKRLALDRGEVELQGKIQEISYHQSGKERTAGGILGRLFG